MGEADDEDAERSAEDLSCAFLDATDTAAAAAATADDDDALLCCDGRWRCFAVLRLCFLLDDDDDACDFLLFFLAIS